MLSPEPPTLQFLQRYIMNFERETARHLRRDMTDAEKFLWNQLRGRRFAGFKFRRQSPIGPYIADFVCFEHRLIVELDGAHHAESEQQAHDERRTNWLAGRGFRVLRFSNDAALTATGKVETAIWSALSGSPSEEYESGGETSGSA